MSEAIRSLGSAKRVSKKEKERRYEELVNDDITFSIDEVLGVLGPRRETI